MTLLNSWRLKMTDERGNSVLEFVLIMPLVLMLVISWITDAGIAQQDKFATVSIVQELARGIELGRTPREIRARVKVLAREVGASGPPTLELMPVDAATATLSVQIGKASEFARVKLANASPAWQLLRSDRGSMLPLFSVFVALMLAIGFTSANVVSGMIADERAQALASTLALDLAASQASEFDRVATELMRSSNSEFRWRASRQDAKTTEVTLCVDFEPPLANFFNSNSRTDKPQACASRSSRAVSSASG